MERVSIPECSGRVSALRLLDPPASLDTDGHTLLPETLNSPSKVMLLFPAHPTSHSVLVSFSDFSPCPLTSEDIWVHLC